MTSGGVCKELHRFDSPRDILIHGIFSPTVIGFDHRYHFFHKRIDESVQFQLGEVWSGHYRFSRDKLWASSPISVCFALFPFLNNLQNNIYKKNVELITNQ